MNLGQLVDNAVVAEAQKQDKTPGPSLEAAKRLGIVNVRTHLATYVPPVGSIDGTVLSTTREPVKESAASPIPSRNVLRAELARARERELLAAIQTAAKPVTRGELMATTRMGSTAFDFSISQLTKSGCITRTGTRGQYRFGLTEWVRKTAGNGEPPRGTGLKVRVLSARDLQRLVDSGDLVRTEDGYE